MSDTEENSDSIDDNTENFVENPTRELLADGFLGFFSPIIENLDSKVKQTVLVQLNINAQLDIISSVIKDQLVRQNRQDNSALENAIKTINAIRARVTVVSNVLQSAQDRLRSASERLASIEPPPQES